MTNPPHSDGSEGNGPDAGQPAAQESPPPAEDAERGWEPPHGATRPLGPWPFVPPSQGPPPYGQPPQGPPPYGQHPHGQPPYAAPQYGAPGYGAPQQSGSPYGRPPYGQPPYGPPQQGPAQPGTPYFGPPGSGGPQYGPPQHGQPPYGQPSYGQPPYGQPPYGSPQGMPGYGGPQHAQQARSSRKALVIGAVAVLALVAVGLVLALTTGPTVLSRSAVEQDVAEQFEQREGVAVDLECAEEMTVEEGATYECSGVTADDEAVTLRIEITDEDGGRYTWSEP